MRIRLNCFLVALAQKLILINLLAVFISGSLVFAQGPEHFVLIATKGNSLNVREGPLASSPVIATLPNNSKVPFVEPSGAESVSGDWFQVEYDKGEFGWVSSTFSKKIKGSKKPTGPQAENIESDSLETDQDVKPMAKTQAEDLANSLQLDNIKEPVTEVDTDSAPVKKRGFFEDILSRFRPDSKPDSRPEEAKIKNTRPWANIAGFRSAKFGMKMKEVKKAIHQDFGTSDEKITTVNHPTERTESLAVAVEKLLPNAVKSRVVYVFGYKTKRLIQVNILLGHPVDANATAQQIVDSGNILGNHFFKKRYQEDGLVAHSTLNDGSILIFRGKDQKGRMVLLHLSNPQPNDKNNESPKMTLSLSYIEKPGKPDAYQLEDGDF
jgi:uncharacterized protein YgiM (DUF1202 family)